MSQQKPIGPVGTQVTGIYQPSRPLRFRLSDPNVLSNLVQTLSTLSSTTAKTTEKLNGTVAVAEKALFVANTANSDNFLGAYSATRSYTPHDEVTYSGNYYICVKSTAGNAPTSTAYWTLVGPDTLDNVVDGPVHGRTRLTALTNGNVDLSQTGVLMKGSVPGSLCPQFTYTSTSTSITWSWGANTAVYRADGTQTYIGSGSQAVTGLNPSTLYNFYPIYDETLAELRFIQTSDITSPQLTGYVGNGTSGYVKTATSLSQPGNFSIEAWMEGSTSPTYANVLLNLAAPQTTGSGTNAVAMLWSPSAGELNVYLNLNSVNTFAIAYTPTNTLLDGQVHHIVFTWNNSTFAGVLYVDGISVATYTGSHALTANTGLYWHLGHGYGSNMGFGAVDMYSTCWLSNAAVYATVLTATQVLANYSAGVNLGQTALANSVAANSATHYWTLTETTGTTAADSAGSDTGTYVATVTLNQAESTHAASGSPAIAWTTNTFLAGQAQILQDRVPLSIGPMQVTTPASGSGTPGTGGGTGPGTHSYY